MQQPPAPPVPGTPGAPPMFPPAPPNPAVGMMRDQLMSEQQMPATPGDDLKFQNIVTAADVFDTYFKSARFGVLKTPENAPPPTNPKVSVVAEVLAKKRRQQQQPKMAAQDNSKPALSATGESKGLTFAHKPDDYDKGPKAWDSSAKYLKRGGGPDARFKSAAPAWLGRIAQLLRTPMPRTGAVAKGLGVAGGAVGAIAGAGVGLGEAANKLRGGRFGDNTKAVAHDFGLGGGVGDQRWGYSKEPTMYTGWTEQQPSPRFTAATPPPPWRWSRFPPRRWPRPTRPVFATSHSPTPRPAASCRHGSRRRAAASAALSASTRTASPAAAAGLGGIAGYGASKLTGGKKEKEANARLLAWGANAARNIGTAAKGVFSRTRTLAKNPAARAVAGGVVVALADMTGPQSTAYRYRTVPFQQMSPYDKREGSVPPGQTILTAEDWWSPPCTRATLKT